MHVPSDRRFIVSMAAIWLALPSLLVYLQAALAADHPVDFWLHVNTGRLICETGTLAGRDQFTCTIAGSELVNQNWLAEAATYCLYRLGGFELCQFAAAACYAAAMGLVVRLALLRCGEPRAAAIAGLAGFALAMTNLGVRPQAVSTLLFAAELYVLWRGNLGGTTIAWVAVMVIAWSNVHGAFVLGAILPTLFLIGAGWRRLERCGWRGLANDRVVWIYLACTLAAIAAMFINPHPSRTLDYVFNTSSRSLERGIEEWLPTTFAAFSGKAFFVSMIAVTCLLGRSRRQLEPEELLLLATFFLLATQALRMVLWFALVFPPIVAPHIAGLLAGAGVREKDRNREPPTPWLPLAGLALALATTLPWTRSYNPLLPAAKRYASGVYEPASAVAFLRDRGYRGNLFAPVSWGAYLTCFLYPDVKVFNDSRIESFPNDVWDDYLQIGAARGDWSAALSKYNIDAVVWSDRLSVDLLAALESSAVWQRAFQDENCAIFLRPTANNRLAGTTDY